MQSKAFIASKVGYGYIENSTISLSKKIDINLQACVWGINAFHNSVSLTTGLQLPNFHLLYQTSLPYVKFSDYCHSAH